MNLHIINLTSPVGFSREALEALTSTHGVHEVIDASPSEDGRYRDLWLRVSEEFNEIATEVSRRGV